MLTHLSILPPVTFSSMSHSVRKIPLTPFSCPDASDAGYWYKISSCRHKNTVTPCVTKIYIQLKETSLVSLSTKRNVT